MPMRPARIALSLIAVFFTALSATAQKPPAAAPKAAPPAAAAPAPTPAPVPAASAAAAMELFKVIKLQTTLQDASGAMIDSEIARNPGLTPYRDVMLGWLRKYMTWEAMVPELTRMYTQAFTDAELKELTAFYRTTAGQKSLERMPELMQRTAMIGARLGQPHSDELKAAMAARTDQLKKEQDKAAAAAAPPASGKAVPKPTPKKP